MKKLSKRLTGMILALAMLITLIPQPAMAKDAEDYHLFLSNFNTDAVRNGPNMAASFTIDRRTFIQAVTTYHWNNGSGKAPGTIMILKDGAVDGEWSAQGRSGSGANNVYWDIFPDYIMETGHTYEIRPSSYDTWSCNDASGGRGFLELRGYAVSDDFKVSGSSGSSSSSASSSGSKSSGSSSGSSSTGCKCSDWARAEVESAESYGLIPSSLKNADLTRPMNRKDFAAVSVNAYSYMSGESVSAASNPFTDTSDTDVLRAYNAGIINGTSATTFSPSANVTREQAATMLTRAYKKIVLSGWTLGTDSDYALSYTNTASFADRGSISDFAKDSVSFMASKGIVKGVDDSHFDPSNSVTAEQALAIAVRMIKNLDTSPQENAKANTNTDTNTDTSATSGGTQANPGELQPAGGGLKLDDITVTFTGSAAIVRDDSDKPDDSTIEVYDVAFDSVPSEAVNFAFDAPAISEAQYLIQIGVPIKDEAGNTGTIWSGVKTTYENGQAKASAYLDGLEEYAQSISGDDIANYTADISQLGIKVTNMPGLTAVKVALTTEIQYSNDKFLLHVPYAIYVDPSDQMSRVYFSDQSAQNLLDDMKSILEYYGTVYDLSPRTSWPMDVYFGDFPEILEYVKITSPLAYFAMPAYSLGGRFFNNAINDSYIKLSQKIFANGYMKKAGDDSSSYGTLAHELFHFVERCYYSKTSLWWDESAATYYDAVMQDKAGYKKDSPKAWLDQNYWEPAIVQYEIIPKAIDGGSDGNYAHMPFFHYCMKEDSDFLKKAFKSLKDNKSQSWESVITGAAGKTMREIAEGYYTSLVCKGELYSTKNLPWEIFDDLNEHKGVYSAIGGALVLEPGAETYFTAIPGYGASFMALDMSRIPATYSSLSVSVKDKTVIDIAIKGSSYSDITYTAYTGGKINELPIDGAKHLLMFVNGEPEVASPSVIITMNKAFNTGEGFAATEEQIGRIPKQYSGKVTYINSEGKIITADASAKLIVSAYDNGASLQITSSDGAFSYTETDLVYSPSTGMCTGRGVTLQLEDSNYGGATSLTFSAGGAGMRVHLVGSRNLAAVFTGRGGGVKIKSTPLTGDE